METPTFLEWLKSLSVERLQQFDIVKSSAESFSLELREYGLPALEVHILPKSQIQLCGAYAFIYR